MFRRVDRFVGDAHPGCCNGSRRRPPPRARSRSRRPPTRLPLAPASSRQRARRGRPGSPWVRVARRRRPPRFAPSRRRRRRRRRRMPLASRPSTADCAPSHYARHLRRTGISRFQSSIPSHSWRAAAKRTRASFVNALCFLQSAKDQIIGSIGPFLRDADEKSAPRRQPCPTNARSQPPRLTKASHFAKTLIFSFPTLNPDQAQAAPDSP